MRDYARLKLVEEGWQMVFQALAVVGAAVIGMMSLPANAQNAFICVEGIAGNPSRNVLGGVNLEGCSDVTGFSSALETAGSNDGRVQGRKTCSSVEVIKGVDAATPAYFERAVRSQRFPVDLLFFTRGPRGGNFVNNLIISLQQSSLAGVTHEFEDGEIIERLSFAPRRIRLTTPENGGEAEVDCVNPGRAG